MKRLMIYAISKQKAGAYVMAKTTGGHGCFVVFISTSRGTYAKGFDDMVEHIWSPMVSWDVFLDHGYGRILWSRKKHEDNKNK